MGSEGRRTAAYRRTAAALRGLPCLECGNPATHTDHQPPLSTFPHPNLWQGTLLPHCATCSANQGAAIAAQLRAATRTPKPTRNWLNRT